MGYAALTAFLGEQGDGCGLTKDRERTPEQWAAYLSGRWMLMSMKEFEAELVPLFKEIQRMGDELAALKAADS